MQHRWRGGEHSGCDVAISIFGLLDCTRFQARSLLARWRSAGSTVWKRRPLLTRYNIISAGDPSGLDLTQERLADLQIVAHRAHGLTERLSLSTLEGIA